MNIGHCTKLWNIGHFTKLTIERNKAEFTGPKIKNIEQSVQLEVRMSIAHLTRFFISRKRDHYTGLAVNATSDILWNWFSVSYITDL